MQCGQANRGRDHCPGCCNAPKLDTATSTAEVVFSATLRIPGLCFQAEQRQQTAVEQLEQARANVEAFSPETLDLRRFKESPFVAKALRTASHVYVRDDRLGKPGLALKYTVQGAREGLEQHTIITNAICCTFGQLAVMSLSIKRIW